MKLSLDSWKCCRCSCQHRPARFWQGPGYFIATPLQVPGKGSARSIGVKLNWTNRALWWTMVWWNGESMNDGELITTSEDCSERAWDRHQLIQGDKEFLWIYHMFHTKMLSRISSSVYEQKFNFHWTPTSKGIRSRYEILPAAASCGIWKYSLAVAEHEANFVRKYSDSKSEYREYLFIFEWLFVCSCFRLGERRFYLII